MAYVFTRMCVLIRCKWKQVEPMADNAKSKALETQKVIYVHIYIYWIYLYLCALVCVYNICVYTRVYTSTLHVGAARAHG